VLRVIRKGERKIGKANPGRIPFSQPSNQSRWPNPLPFLIPRGPANPGPAQLPTRTSSARSPTSGPARTVSLSLRRATDRQGPRVSARFRNGALARVAPDATIAGPLVSVFPLPPFLPQRANRVEVPACPTARTPRSRPAFNWPPRNLCAHNLTPQSRNQP